MICIFKNTAKKKQLIETNGEYVLDNICTYGMITEGLNDEFTLEIEFEILDTVKKELYDLITEEGILKVEDEYGDEFFVISEIYKTSDSIRAIARQITIAETLDLFLEDVRPENQNGAGALTHIFSNTTCTHEIVVNSDIQTISTAYYNRKTVYEALHDSDMAFQERWGGEVYRRQFNLHINNKVGSYRGVKIKSNKNLTGFEENTTKDTVCTRIYPKGFNGITIEEKYIDSENIGMYKRPISRVYTFEDVKVRDENTGEDEEVFETLEEAQEELKKRSKALFEEDKVDFIKAYYTINHVDLRTTEEYKNYSATEITCIGDEVDVEEETLGIDIRTRVVKRKYNILTKEREETELSNVGLKRVITLPELEKEFEKIPSTESFLEAAKEIATGLINSGIKNSHVVVRKNEILIMDTDDINTAQKVWRFNVNGLGYSSTGYHGEFGLAMTMDGSIVADFINVGTLNANLIKSGVIKSLNEKTWIDMNNGSFNFANNLTMDEEGNIVYKGTITGSYADLRDTLLINGKGGNGWAQILLRSSTGLEGNIYTGGEKSLNMFAPSGIYIGGYRAVLEDKDDKWKMWTTDGGKGKAIFFDAVNGKIYSEGMPLTLSALGGRVQTETNFYVKGSCNPISHATGGMDLGASNLRWYTLYCVTAINTSDKRYKKNIKYLDEDNRVPVSNFSSRTSSVNKDEYKYYDFIKNELKLAEYDYDRQDSTYRVEDHQIGFIAQDIINTEIGGKFCYELEEGLGFSATGYTSIIAKALQEAIQKIESLEKEIQLLKG